uniref:Uncharacterized protein n=1 Tax=Heterorhabditis bacteriophora TaxID=37862 RepID=A0A1I7WUG3_HETBA
MSILNRIFGQDNKSKKFCLRNIATDMPFAEPSALGTMALNISEKYRLLAQDARQNRETSMHTGDKIFIHMYTDITSNSCSNLFSF